MICTLNTCQYEALPDDSRGRCADHQLGMSDLEFKSGWILLIMQPWGARYNKTDRQGHPTAESKLQLTLYYSKLKHGSLGAWMKTVDTYVTGHDWPSVDDLRKTMRGHEPIRAQLTDQQRTPPASVPMPDEVKRMVKSLFGKPKRTFGCFVDESVSEEHEASHV